ncbi:MULTISPECIES: hypothetical protein [unclassified Cellvibrio]|uniref:hypothetical protein n=1 Tax=unclassified Cellvibrio TaxID=2624793 RepID=UPI0012478F13|nr:MULTISPECIES: hypothetical protein [unclassified Cellvibrio]QEY10865.1 hypothetical protein D0B88_00490 [Cellvibrio sp. KY-YJ-3]UUA70911.1 hypothetical protein NNX04_10790 [Cellvibrio sp. QJXJ]
MQQPPHKRLIDPDELFASREIRFQDRRESQYPLLMRLCADFNFSVLQLQRKLFSHLSRKTVPGALEFVLATRDESTNFWCSLSPGVADLKALNDYAKHYEVDILHLQLFGEETDQNQVGDAYY